MIHWKISMMLYDVFKEAIALGLRNDFRGETAAVQFSWHEFIDSGDGRSFLNAYPDSGVVNARSLLVPVKTVVMGIDIGIEEVLVMLDWSRRRGKTIDAFIGHHPEGRIQASFPQILYTHEATLAAHGVDVRPIRDKYDDLVNKLCLDVLSDNYMQIHDSLSYLDVNYLSIHTPSDNAGARYIEHLLARAAPKTLGDVCNRLLAVHEYAYYEGVNNTTPLVVNGSPADPLGRYTLTEFTGGEEGPPESFRAMKAGGVDTVICMHMTDEGLATCKEVGLNVISTGHVTSDSVGLNLFGDILEKRGIEIIPTSGFVRVSRV